MRLTFGNPNQNIFFFLSCYYRLYVYLFIHDIREFEFKRFLVNSFLGKLF